jgi:hypothetical protein
MGKVTPPIIPRPKKTLAINLDGGGITSVTVDGNNNNLVVNTLNGGKFVTALSSLINNPMAAWNASKLVIKGISDMVNADFDNATKKYMNSNRPKEKIENRFVLPKELFEMVDFTNMGVVNEPKKFVPKFVKGEKYALSGVSCEGFEMPEKVYELVGIHDEYDGININSVIVKQISGDQDKIFTLSKNDCACMGIEYENGLQLFPKYLNWRRVKEIIPFDSSNLGTTPLSDIDNTIRYALVKINGFKDYVDGYVLTPSGKIIKEEQFEKSLKITCNEPFVYGNGVILRENTPLDIEIVYPEELLYKYGNFISDDNTIYVLIKLTKNVENVIKTFDGLTGVERVYLDGFNPNDHFEISWDELGAYTIEEYEAEKARKEKIRQERLAKEEAERQKRIAEEEKRIREQRAKVEQAVTKMKGYNIAMPKFPKMPDFNMENGLSSLNFYVDGVELYFNSLDRQLTKLSNDLSLMSKSIGINLDKKMSKEKENQSLYDLYEMFNIL